MNSSRTSYRVREAIRAVRFTHESGRSGTIVLIPQHALIHVHGPGLSANFMQIEWENELYSVLSDDLESHADRT